PLNSVPKVPNFSFPSQREAVLTQAISSISPEQLNEYRSASAFMQAIANEALMWKNQLPENFRPAILAVLNGGIQIKVHTLSQVSFHGIRIEGELNGGPCSLMAHQSTVQILCYGQEVIAKEEPRPIGFIWPDNEVEV
ncbi:MAG: hypothetical protein ACRBCI_16280, partial [Cellvibrionaceae bacterium]